MELLKQIPVDFADHFNETDTFQNVQGTYDKESEQFVGGGARWNVQNKSNNKITFVCAQCGTAELFIDDTKINENGHFHGTVEIRVPHQPDCFLWNKARLTLKYMIAIRKHFDETEWKSNLGFLIDRNFSIHLHLKMFCSH